MAKLELPEVYSYWKVLLYRVVRGAFATALTQTLLLNPDWAKPEEAIKVLAVSLVSGFLLALGKAVRDEFGDEKYNKVDKLMPL